MSIPLAYNFRNLRVRRTATALTALGIALPVAVLLASLALLDGVRAAFRASGDPANVLVLRKGATSELSSSVARGVFDDVAFAPGVARSAADGRPEASLEIVTTVDLANDGATRRSVTLRGMMPAGVELRRARLVDGRWFEPGKLEMVVGASVARRFPEARVGSRLRVGRADWDVVGVMTRDEAATDSEVWADVNRVGAEFNRSEQFSSVLVRATDAASVPALVAAIAADRRVGATAVSERDYFASMSESGSSLEVLGLLVAAVMAVGAAFAAMNTSYAAVAGRGREIATLRTLGFSRATILASFLVVSLVVSLVGGALGCLLALPLSFVDAAVGSAATLSEVSFGFRVGPLAVLAGLGFALAVGAAGGLLPARSAARKEIVAALRET